MAGDFYQPLLGFIFLQLTQSGIWNYGWILCSLQTNVSLLTKTVFYHRCWVFQLAPYLSQEDLAMILHTTAILKLDYCNVLYAGLALKTLWKL